MVKRRDSRGRFLPNPKVYAPKKLYTIRVCVYGKVYHVGIIESPELAQAYQDDIFNLLEQEGYKALMVTILERDIQDPKDWRSIIPTLTSSLLETIKEDQPWYVKMLNWIKAKCKEFKLIS
jgi:hypothetical protein|nr:MAG TPA: hypothetical protein [Caudoviricetes sp.]